MINSSRTNQQQQQQQQQQSSIDQEVKTTTTTTGGDQQQQSNFSPPPAPPLPSALQAPVSAAALPAASDHHSSAAPVATAAATNTKTTHHSSTSYNKNILALAIKLNENNLDDNGTYLSTDADEIIPNLYLGSWQAALNVKFLKCLNITHILTLEESELPDNVKSQFTYKFKRLDDSPYSNLLEHLDDCVEFIDEALKTPTSILVHCWAGVSRSASIVTAYLMYKKKKPFKEMLRFIQEKRRIRPNVGFSKQLEFFEKMDYKLPKESAAFKAFMLEKLAEHVKSAGNYREFVTLKEYYSLNAAADETTPQIAAAAGSENVPCYKCKKCRSKLFTVNELVRHLKNFEKNEFTSPSNYWSEKLSYYQKLNDQEKSKSDECTSELYIEPMDWFKDRLDELNGKINCPKCGTKLGSFDWCGSKCSCNTWVTPAFHISVSKVDYSPI